MENISKTEDEKLNEMNEMMQKELELKIKNVEETAVQFESLKKRKIADGYSVDVESLKKIMEKDFRVPAADLKSIKSFEEVTKFRGILKLEFEDTFETKKKKLYDLDKARVILLRNCTEMKESFEKTVILNQSAKLLQAIQLTFQFAGPIAKTFVGLMQVLTLSYASKFSEKGVKRFELEFVEDEPQSNSITFYLMDIELMQEDTSRWWIPFMKYEKEVVCLKILSAVGIIPK